MKQKSSPRPQFSRRTFFAKSGLISATVAAGGILSTKGVEPGPNQSSNPRKVRVGLELYSVRGEMDHDLPKTLTEVAKMGYEVVEFYAPYFKWTPPYAKEVRAQMDDLGIRCYSTHNGFESFTPGDNFSHAIELNQILGARYIVLASAPGRNGVDGWKNLCEKLTSA